MQRLTELIFFSKLSDYFSDTELANLLGEPSPGARFGLVKRAMAKGEILSIRRGLYLLAKPFRRRPLNDLALAGRIYRPSYVSREMALAQHEFIPETAFSITSSCFRRSATFETPVGRFEYLRTPFGTWAGVRRQDHGDGEPYLLATPLRALADIAHHRKEELDLRFLTESMRIDGDRLHGLAPGGFDSLLRDLGRSRSPAVRFLKNLQRELRKR